MVPLTKVEPWLMIEVAADSAMQGGRYRHPLRFVRVRADLTADDGRATRWSERSVFVTPTRGRSRNGALGGWLDAGT